MILLMPFCIYHDDTFFKLMTVYCTDMLRFHRIPIQRMIPISSTDKTLGLKHSASSYIKYPEKRPDTYAKELELVEVAKKLSRA